MRDEKLVKDLKDTLSLLEDYLRLYWEGKEYHYQGVAVQLRKLCCDTQRGQDNSLLVQLYPEITFHPCNEPDSEWLKELREKIANPGKSRVIFASPVVFSTDSIGIASVVDEELKPIRLSEWLDEMIHYGTTLDGQSGEITIRSLIRSIADKVGAHADKNYDEVLNITGTTSSPGPAQEYEKTYIGLVTRLGEYVLRRVREHIKQIE